MQQVIFLKLSVNILLEKISLSVKKVFVFVVSKIESLTKILLKTGKIW